MEGGNRLTKVSELAVVVVLYYYAVVGFRPLQQLIPSAGRHYGAGGKLVGRADIYSGRNVDGKPGNINAVFVYGNM